MSDKLRSHAHEGEHVGFSVIHEGGEFCRGTRAPVVAKMRQAAQNPVKREDPLET
jgi:hypothetical protein